MNNCGKILTGDWVGSAWGSSPEWTPYAQAIADHYPIQVPWYMTLQTPTLDLDIPFKQVTHSHQHDVLILGAEARAGVGIETDTGGSIYLDIADKKTGISWAVPNKFGMFPLPALAGMAVLTGLAPSAMPVMRLPESFFLPARTPLTLTWMKPFDNPLAQRATLTLIGVQLINPTPGFRAPTHVGMPGGKTIEVGSRMPWFSTTPLGEYQSRSIGDFELAPETVISQFMPPIDCDVEMHDIYVNGGIIPFGNQASIKLTDMGAQTYWTPTPAPTGAVFGSTNQVNPALPFTKPYLLRKGHRIQIAMQNNSTIGSLTGITVTFRGVRLCEY